MEPPEFAYALKVQGGDISFLPGLEAWLNSIIKNVVLGPYILPEGITVPIDPESTNAQVGVSNGRSILLFSKIALQICNHRPEGRKKIMQ